MQYIAPIMLKIEARHSHVLIVYIDEMKRRQSLGRIALIFVKGVLYLWEISRKNKKEIVFF